MGRPCDPARVGVLLGRDARALRRADSTKCYWAGTINPSNATGLALSTHQRDTERCAGVPPPQSQHRVCVRVVVVSHTVARPAPARGRKHVVALPVQGAVHGRPCVDAAAHTAAVGVPVLRPAVRLCHTHTDTHGALVHGVCSVCPLRPVRAASCVRRTLCLSLCGRSRFLSFFRSFFKNSGEARLCAGPSSLVYRGAAAPCWGSNEAKEANEANEALLA